MRIFLRHFDFAACVNENDITMWVRRFDSDGDMALSFSDFATALQTMCNYDRHKVVEPQQPTIMGYASRSNIGGHDTVSNVHFATDMPGE